MIRSSSGLLYWKETELEPTPTELLPAAIVAIPEIGLQKFEQESNIAVDAAKVNPRPTEGLKKRTQ
jgi:hypothetical protein